MTDIAAPFPDRTGDRACGRPLRSRRGRTCVVTAAVLPGFGTTWYQLPACMTHLTTEERETLRAFEEALLAENRARRARVVPACWLWPFGGMVELERDAPRASIAMYPNLSSGDRADLHALGLILAWQAGRCAICGQPDLSGLRMVEDHDHWTTFVRGYLCHACNTSEGKSTHPVYDKYRARNPASILGVTARYWDPWSMRYAKPDPLHMPRGLYELVNDPWDDPAAGRLGL